MREPWIKAYYCVACKEELSRRTVAYSNGTCPLCGNIDSSTFVNVVEKAKRWVWTRKAPWWKFWDNGEGHWEIKDE